MSFRPRCFPILAALFFLPVPITNAQTLWITQDAPHLSSYHAEGKSRSCPVPLSYSQWVETTTSGGGQVEASGPLKALAVGASVHAERTVRRRQAGEMVRPEQAQVDAVRQFDTCIQYLYGAFTEREYADYVRIVHGLAPEAMDPLANPNTRKWAIQLYSFSGRDVTGELQRFGNVELDQLEVVDLGPNLKYKGTPFAQSVTKWTLVAVGFPSPSAARHALRNLQGSPLPSGATPAVINLRSLCPENSFDRLLVDLFDPFITKLRCVRDRPRLVVPASTFNLRIRRP